MGGYQYLIHYTEQAMGVAGSNDRPTNIVLCANEHVKGGWLATPSTPPGSAKDNAVDIPKIEYMNKILAGRFFDNLSDDIPDHHRKLPFMCN